jgi:hypothetical protein
MVMSRSPEAVSSLLSRPCPACGAGIGHSCTQYVVALVDGKDIGGGYSRTLAKGHPERRVGRVLTGPHPTLGGDTVKTSVTFYRTALEALADIKAVTDEGTSDAVNRAVRIVGEILRVSQDPTGYASVDLFGSGRLYEIRVAPAGESS